MKASSFIIKITILLFAFSVKGYASDSLKVDLSLGADVVNHYVWRGLMLSNSPSVQPSMSLSYNGFSLGTWASYSINPADFQEVDLFLTYTTGNFTVGVNDYYNPTDSLWKKDKYFNLRSKSTLHTLEPFISFSEIGGTHFSFGANVFAYGNDKGEDGKNLFSSYFELSYSATVKDYEVVFFGGGTPRKGYYAGKAAVTNVGVTLSKDIEVTDKFSIPCKGSFIVNPDTQNVFLVLSVSF